MNTADFLIIGGGIIGITLALEIKRRHPDCKVVILEKENDIATHASGRNSGVLHAGFYYTADSLKARFTRDGNALMRQYCEDKNLSINKCGKLVVATNENELETLKLLKSRGDKNMVELDWLSASEAKKIEPRVRTYKQALWSPTTSSVNPVEVVHSLARDAEDLGIEFHTETQFKKRRNGNTILTNKGKYQSGYIINCAGLYADKIAMEFGFSNNYRILPFKGLYLYAQSDSYKLKTNIYPVPDLGHPFLGVHFTVTVDGKTKIGPTAIPAFWREHYQGLGRFALNEFGEIVYRELKLLISNKFGFRDLAVKEMQKYAKKYMIGESEKLFENAQQLQFTKWGKPGIRAQLIDIKKNQLEMDFKYEGDNRSFHVLNAVSPAFTCSLAFSNHLADVIGTHLS